MKYKSWVTQFRSCALCKIDSKKFDFRNTAISLKICEEIKTVLAKPENSLSQLLLPGFSSTAFPIDPPEILDLIIPVEKPIRTNKFIKVKKGNLTYPSVYIAAPFTAIASDFLPKKGSKQIFFDFDTPHGVISKGAYRSSLNTISRFFKRIGFSVLLPHRDINHWGEKMLLPQDVFSECTRSVKACDLFIGLLGFSHGSHYEFGLALGQHKPSIILSSEDVQQSFIANGIRDNQDKILLLELTEFQPVQINKLLKSTETLNFLKIYFPLEEL